MTGWLAGTIGAGLLMAAVGMVVGARLWGGRLPRDVWVACTLVILAGLVVATIPVWTA